MNTNMNAKFAQIIRRRRNVFAMIATSDGLGDQLRDDMLALVEAADADWSGATAHLAGALGHMRAIAWAVAQAACIAHAAGRPSHDAWDVVVEMIQAMAGAE